MDRIRKGVLVALIAALAIVLAACAVPTTNVRQPSTSPSVTATQPSTTTTATGTKMYAAVLKPVNRSGVVGEVVVIARGSNLLVQVRARGLEPNQQHAQHIHGFGGSQASTCPPSVTGTVTQEPEAEQSYGPVLVPLTPFPTADASGSIAYRGTVAASSAIPTITLLPLDGRAVVLHGMMVGGTFDPSVPVACGELKAVGGGTPPAGLTTATPGEGTTPGEGAEEATERPGSSAETP